MATIDNNPFVRGARGNVGKQFVFRRRGDKTHIMRMPVFKNKIPTAQQKERRELFSFAASYAAGAMSIPALKKQYQQEVQPAQTAYNIAFRDYLKAPKVNSIDASRYTGMPGSTIGIDATDDFRVVRVIISIHSAAGLLIEEGDAAINPIDWSKWTYTTRQINSLLAGSVIRATALDIPQNKGIFEMTI
jgi:hypothetical protein